MRTGQNILNQGLLRSPEVTAHREGRGALLTRTLWFLETRDHRETHTRKGLSTFAFLKSYLWLCRGLHCCTRAFSGCGEHVSSPVVGGCSRHGAWAPERRPVAAACGPRCLLACGISPPGMEPTSPALAGGFSTSGPPGKSWASLLLLNKEEG